MINWYTTVLKKYVEFNGRSRRAEFWNFVLVNALINIALFIVGSMIGNDILRMIYAFAVLLPALGAAIRRMHDIDKSGWFILIPIYNIVLWAGEGTKGANQYGPDPKATPDTQVV